MQFTVSMSARNVGEGGMYVTVRIPHSHTMLIKVYQYGAMQCVMTKAGAESCGYILVIHPNFIPFKTYTVHMRREVYSDLEVRAKLLNLGSL